MNSQQRFAVIVGLLALASTAAATPFRVSGHDSFGSDARYVVHTIYRPAFRAPNLGSVQRIDEADVIIRESAVETGMLGLMWAVILAAVGARVVLARRPKGA